MRQRDVKSICDTTSVSPSQPAAREELTPWRRSGRHVRRVCDHDAAPALAVVLHVSDLPAVGRRGRIGHGPQPSASSVPRGPSGAAAASCVMRASRRSGRSTRRRGAAAGHAIRNELPRHHFDEPRDHRVAGSRAERARKRLP